MPIACQIVFAVTVTILVFGIPESPRWLYYHGKSDEALAVLCDVWDASPEDDYVKKTNKDITDTIALEEQHGKYRFRDLLKVCLAEPTGHARLTKCVQRDRVQTGRRVLLAWGMQFMNQMGKFILCHRRTHAHRLILRQAASISWYTTCHPR